MYSGGSGRDMGRGGDMSPLTLIGVIKGPKSRKRKEMKIVEVAEEPQEEEEEPIGMKQIPEEAQLPVEDEV